MAQVAIRSPRASSVRLETERLVLHLPPPDHAARVVEYFRRNHTHLAPWEPARPEGFYEPGWWAEQLGHNLSELEDGRSLRLFLRNRRDPDGPVIGTCNFSNIIRGAFLACHLGYGLDQEHEGRGMMSEALRAAIPYSFRRLGLHRIMANYQPINERSGLLLRRLGFVVEGYARDYLFIDGAWRDHVLTSLTYPGPFTT